MGTTGELVSLGEVLRRRRLAAGWTHRAWAGGGGLSARTIRALERGRSQSPQARSVHGLAAALGLGLADRERLLAARRTRPAAGPDPAALALHVGILGPLSVRL